MRKTINSVSRDELVKLLEHFGFPVCTETLIKEHGLNVEHSNGQWFATRDTRPEDNNWWNEHRHKSTKPPYWRDSDRRIYCFVAYGSSKEIATFKCTLHYMKGDLLDDLINS